MKINKSALLLLSLAFFSLTACNNRDNLINTIPSYNEVLQKDVTRLLDQIKRKPDDSDAYFSLGKIYLDSERPDEAAALLKKSSDLRPTFAFAHYKLGDAYYKLISLYGKQEHIPAAIGEYIEYLKASPKDSEAYYRLGNLYAWSLKVEDARKAYKQAIELNPKNVQAYQKIADLPIKLFMPTEESIKLLEIIKNDPKNVIKPIKQR